MCTDMPICAYCQKKTGRGKAFCRPHWMAIGNWHRVQIGNEMRDEKASGEGPDEEGSYHSQEYQVAVQNAVDFLRSKERETYAQD